MGVMCIKCGCYVEQCGYRPNVEVIRSNVDILWSNVNECGCDME